MNGNSITSLIAYIGLAILSIALYNNLPEPYAYNTILGIGIVFCFVNYFYFLSKSNEK